MDEDSYRTTYDEVAELACPFEKLILSATGSRCAMAHKFNLADREGVECTGSVAQPRCEELLRQLRLNARFALRQTHLAGSLPHGKELKVQGGGILGLWQVVCPEREVQRVEDIHGLIEAAQELFGELERFPYSEIVQAIAHYQGRRRFPRG